MVVVAVVPEEEQLLTSHFLRRYMRRKPRVITLDLPSETESGDGDAEDSDETENEDSEGQGEGHGKELRLALQKDPMADVKSRGEKCSDGNLRLKFNSDDNVIMSSSFSSLPPPIHHPVPSTSIHSHFFFSTSLSYPFI